MDGVTHDPNCDCCELGQPPAVEIATAETCDCNRVYHVVLIDDVPVGTGRIDEHGRIVDVEYDRRALAKLGLKVE